MAFPFLAAIPVVGKIIEKVVGVVDQAVEDKDQAKKLKAEMTLAAMSMDHSEIQTLVQEQSSIIRAEATGRSWLQRNWRPMLMLIIMVIIANNYIFFPYLAAFGVENAVMLELPAQMWTLITLGVSGYVVGRSGEKIAKTLKDNK